MGIATDQPEALAESRARLARMTEADQEVVLGGMPEAMKAWWREHFPAWAHEGQTPPDDEAWRTWVIMGGRGFGKTRAGAEWVLAQVRVHPEPGAMRVALVGATVDEARAVMVDGPSGLVTLAREGEVAAGPEASGGSSSPTGRKRRCSPGGRRSRCAGRSMTWPGATSWGNGRAPGRRGTC